MEDVTIGTGSMQGKGVYAARDFKAGDVIITYNLTPLSAQQYKLLSRVEKNFTHSIWGQLYLYSEPERYVNHSDTPNTKQDLLRGTDIALRDIAKGEMITTDAIKDDTPLIPIARSLAFPLTGYKLNGLGFLKEATYSGVYWGFHVAEDILRPAGTPITSIGSGRVVYSAFHPGSAQKGNWGNLIVIGHRHPTNKRAFFSVYAHMQTRLVNVDDVVKKGQLIGNVGAKDTPENGWWDEEHLHFGLYTGLFRGQVLPGYWTPDSTRTHKEDWENPTDFISNYPLNKGFLSKNP